MMHLKPVFEKGMCVRGKRGENRMMMRKRKKKQREEEEDVRGGFHDTYILNLGEK